MKRFNKITLISLVAFCFSPALLAAEDFKLDPSHSYVLWQVDHFGFSHITGKWLAQGDITLDKNNLANSKVKVTIKVGELNTGIKDLDKHLKGKQFFDVSQFPTATFVSDKVEVNNDQISKVHGTLTVRAISKPITLNINRSKMGTNPITEKETLGFSGTAELKRSDFGINAFVPDVGDEIKIQIEGEASKK